MAKTTIDERIATEKKKLNRLEERRIVIDDKIKEAKSNLEKYEIMRNNNQYLVLSDALGEAGVHFDDIIAAIASGDISSLQNMLQKDTPSTHEDEDNTPVTTPATHEDEIMHEESATSYGIDE